MHKLALLCPIVFLLCVCGYAADSNPPSLLRFPTVSKTQIVFNYGGDLWIASREGGEARRVVLAAGPTGLLQPPAHGQKSGSHAHGHAPETRLDNASRPRNRADTTAEQPVASLMQDRSGPPGPDRGEA